MNETTQVTLSFVLRHPASVSLDPGLTLLLPLPLLALGVLLYVVLLSRHRKASGGALAPLSRVGSVTEPLTPEGAVLVGGELWRARTRTGERVECGTGNVVVVGARGHLLEVEPRGESPPRSS